MEWLNQVDLAFRTELRQSNETNLARIEAMLQQRLAEFRAEMHEFKTEMRGEMSTLRVEIAGVRGEIAGFRGDLNAMKAELIKWMFLFWAGSALAGLLLK